MSSVNAKKRNNPVSNEDDALTPKRVTHTPSDKEIHLLQHPASLLALHLDSLTGILYYLNEYDLMLLLMSGNKRFSCHVGNAVHSIRLIAPTQYNGITQPISPTKLLRIIQNDTFPNVKTIHVALSKEISVQPKMSFTIVDLAVLPRSITKITFKRLHLYMPTQKTPNYTNLVNLRSLTFTTVQLKANELECINSLARNAPNLVELVYLPLGGVMLDVLPFIPNSLEMLGIYASALQSICDAGFPPNLTALKLQFNKGNVSGSIPSTVTSLKLVFCANSNVVSGYFISNKFLLTDPSSIRHLSVTDGGHCDLMPHIQSLTKLETLKLRWVVIYSMQLNWSLLPKSVTYVDYPGSIDPESWKDLPPAVRFGLNSRSDTLFVISSLTLDSEIQYIPMGSPVMTCFSRPLPVYMPRLRHVHFHRIAEGRLKRKVADEYMVNLPTCLQSITVHTTTKEDSFWLHNNGSDSLQFKSRFPYLTSLNVSLNREVEINAENLGEWLLHLPSTLLKLVFQMSISEFRGDRVVKIANKHEPINLNQLKFPKMLEVLIFGFWHFKRPALLPDVIQSTIRTYIVATQYSRQCYDVSKGAWKTCRGILDI